MSAALFYISITLIAFIVLGALGDFLSYFFMWGGGAK